ncbi:hypothetical protein SLNWT_2524 [Streptomyces albus]|uniref:Uncharacterized protein n=1 Tax=Streptomyces albus (strain ATCC 21838 / DSM 41398 / FERM P-419 / JCM 4703 / NBRC 107858) TaxID=1081613 RepID=A0A0B5EUJ3_STRA4|nr:hypothetical protein SLNWT_2524 [Streptomyces albus]AOU77211.1 hypothetical protein SLNHY_2520 [Streptomyces albus]AYN32989.1 hypothetical protein DUI70_2487 [Streptomyces albus]
MRAGAAGGEGCVRPLRGPVRGPGAATPTGPYPLLEGVRNPCSAGSQVPRVCGDQRLVGPWHRRRSRPRHDHDRDLAEALAAVVHAGVDQTVTGQRLAVTRGRACRS